MYSQNHEALFSLDISMFTCVYLLFFFYRNKIPLTSPVDFNIHLILSSRETLFMNMVKWKIKHIGN